MQSRTVLRPLGRNKAALPRSAADLSLARRAACGRPRSSGTAPKRSARHSALLCRLRSRFAVSGLAGLQHAFQRFQARGQIAALNRLEAHACKIADATRLFERAGVAIVEN